MERRAFHIKSRLVVLPFHAVHPPELQSRLVQSSNLSLFQVVRVAFSLLSIMFGWPRFNLTRIRTFFF
jgi:hypothetical protein